MKTKAFQDTALSCLGMGNMRLPVGEDGKIDYAKAGEIIDYVYRHGVNYFDTAWPYHSGESETFLGDIMPKYPRESYHLATKYVSFAGPDYKGIFEAQLKKLKTDYIDFYLIHAVFDNNADDYINSGCIEYFKEQKRLGRIRHFGFSSHASVATLEKFIKANDEWDFAQIQLNYMDWTLQDAKGQYEMLTQHRIPVMVMEPVRGGRLAKLTPETEAELKAVHPDWSIPSWAFRWLMRLPNVQVILSGMTTLEQAVNNVETFTNGEALSDADAELLLQVCEKYQKQISVPCTACRYCCDGCPEGIDIPAMMEIYNSLKVSGIWGIKEQILSHEKNAANCIGCGACATHCPQSIQIPDVMSELAAIVG
ncbi:aldo/keto reductase [Dysosmobacter welbionis]|uniref:aldo/keto reductase n=1 Tax=Dysosmobacter welbionis TaxID=2093857 RepID=UPI0032C01C07